MNISKEYGDGFNLDAFLSGPPVVSDSTNVCNYLIELLKKNNFEDRVTDAFWKAILNTPSEDLSEGLTSIIKNQPTVLKSKICASKERNFFVTPLIAAIFAGNVQHIKVLLEHTKDINKADKEGYTAVHYAAMVSSHEVLNLFKSMGADFDRENQAGTSAAEFIRHRFYHLPGVRDFSVYLDHTGPAYNHHFFLLKSQNKSTYLPFLIYEPETFVAMRILGIGNSKNAASGSYLYSYIYDQYLKKCEIAEEVPPIYIKQLESKDDGSPIPDNLEGQSEARARRDISMGELIMEYTGYCTSANFSQTEGFKRLECGGRWKNLAVDAMKGGNSTVFINDGPPNCFGMTVMHNGLPHIVIVAMKEIMKDEPIHIVYGKNFFKHGGIPHAELAPNALKDFIDKTKNLSELFPIAFHSDKKELYGLSSNEKKSSPIVDCLEPDQLVQSLCKVFYNTEMIRYLISYESDLQKNIENGLINPFILRQVLFGLNKMKHLGLDQKEFDKLFNKVTYWAQNKK